MTTKNVYFEKNEWYQNFDAFQSYIRLSHKNSEYLRIFGRIPTFAVFEEQGRIIPVGEWAKEQRLSFMMKYKGMTLEEILESSEIPEEDKRRMNKLLSIGMTYSEGQRSENWNDNLDICIIYINSSDKNRKYLEKNGRIPVRAEIKVHGKIFLVGKWVDNQRKKLMPKYYGMTVEQIRDDNTIPIEDKRKMLILLKLGVGYLKKSPQELLNEWYQNFDAAKKHIDESPKNRKEFEKYGTIITAGKVALYGKTFHPQKWMDTQRNGIMKKYQGRTRDDILSDKKVPQEDKWKMMLLLDLGVKYKEENEQIVSAPESYVQLNGKWATLRKDSNGKVQLTHISENDSAAIDKRTLKRMRKSAHFGRGSYILVKNELGEMQLKRLDEKE